MHDPMTVVFEIKRPWPKRSGLRMDGRPWLYWPDLVTVWHVDPETDGSDDSCDWFNRKRRGLRIHPRWHIWHWRIQIRPLQEFKRWVWGRCRKCGRGFSWGYCPVSDQWHSDGPTWFKSERSIYHADCSNPDSENVAMSEPAPTPKTEGGGGK